MRRLYITYAALIPLIGLVSACSGESGGQAGATPGDGKNFGSDSKDASGGDDAQGEIGDGVDGLGIGDGKSQGTDEPVPMEDKKPSDQPEVCDGKDNDGDGSIDNVDAGGDGICDCLSIGTIGRIGPWSNGGDIFKDWLNARSPMPAFEIGDQELTSELLAGLNVIVVLRADTAPLSVDESPAHHEFSEQEVEALESWVRAGGGLMTTIGYQSDEVSEVVNVNRLLAPLGTGYDSTHTDLDAGFLETWDSAHPIAYGVAKINIENGVRPLTDQGSIVAWGEGDKPGIVAQQADEGRVIVFGDEWVTYDSEWADTEEQQVELLWLNMIKWMSPPKSCQVTIPPELVVR